MSVIFIRENMVLLNKKRETNVSLKFKAPNVLGIEFNPFGKISCL